MELLQRHAVESVADVRTMPFSRFNPQFNRHALERDLHATGIRYLFLGEELGGRPDGDRFYDQEGHVLYGRMSESPRFESGLSRLVERADTSRVAVMCSEEDPAGCHRFLLITRVLHLRGTGVAHIRGDGSTQRTEDVDAFQGWSEPVLRVALRRVGEKFVEIHPAGDARRPFLRGAGGRAAILGAGVPRSTARPVGFPIWCLATSSAARDLAVTVPRGGTTLGLDYRKEDPVAKVLVLDVGVRPGC